MARLYPSIHPELTRDAVDKLFKCKIYTALSFVETDPEIIVKITGLQYRKVVAIRKAILSKFSSHLVTGYKLYVDSVNQRAIISTGIDGLDKLLGGGFLTGKIYELCGPSSSGKTQICMTIGVNICHLLKSEKVLYIDTKNDASAHRMFQIADNNSRKIRDVGELLNKIRTERIRKGNDLVLFLHDLSGTVEDSGIRVIIIDSLPPLYFPYFGSDKNEGQVFLNNLANILRYLAVEKNLVVLVTNLLSSWTVETETEEEEEEGNRRIQETPFLGKYWIHIPSTRLTARRVGPTGEIVLTIAKSSEEAVGKTVVVRVTKGGVN